MNPETLERLRRLLCALGDAIRHRIVEARSETAARRFADVAAKTTADTIYFIDRVSEEAIVAWMEVHWPGDLPVEVVMEGIDGATVTFPAGTPVAATHWKCILDPIDGTRAIMHDKRSAWSLAAVAPQRGATTNLGDIVVAAMTELPVTKQWRADQISAVRGEGPAGVFAEGVNVLTGSREGIALRRSEACDVKHGFASAVKFFPEGRVLTAQVEEVLFASLGAIDPAGHPLVFDDQYTSTGGQVYELLAGRDRLIADLRPLVFAKLGMPAVVACHPYDICTALILEEAGGVIETPAGLPLQAPLDTTSSVAWVGYANPRLAAAVRPVLQSVLRELGLR